MSNELNSTMTVNHGTRSLYTANQITDAYQGVRSVAEALRNLATEMERVALNGSVESDRYGHGVSQTIDGQLENVVITANVIKTNDSQGNDTKWIELNAQLHF